ncbi:MAG: ABC transporter permease [Gemmatimonadaceae bacterium]
MRRSQSVAIAFVVALAAGTTLLLSSTGFDVARAFGALIRGSVGSWYAFGSGTLVRATPLILTGLAVAVAFRAGVFNIGAEGQFVVGAVAATWVALTCGTLPRPLTIPLVLAAGGVAGGMWAGIASWLRIRFRVLEVISTIMLNFIAAFAVSYLVRGPMQEPTHVYPQTETIAASAQLPRLGSTTRLHAGFLVAVVACAVVWWYVRFTAAGFRLRAVGANPDAARSAGRIDVTRVSHRAFVASGALAGIAGAIEVSGVTFALYENISPGYGYTAIAVAMLARLDALGVILTGTVFGALEAGATAMQRDAGVPSVVVSVVEACIILALVALGRVRVTQSGGAR